MLKFLAAFPLFASLLSLLALEVTARPSSYAFWVADSVIRRGQGNGLDGSGKPVVSYEHGELQFGLRQLYELTGNKTYYDYIVSGASRIVSSTGSVSPYTMADYNIDPVRTGPTFLYLYQQTKQQKWKSAADTFRKQLETHPRTGQGQFWHKKRYFNQGWLDGIYMGDVFYAQYTKDFQPNNATAWADIALQFSAMYQNSLQNPGVANYTGLLYHGYDYSHTAVWANQDRGHSPEIWDRALGWYMMALVDVLDFFPPHNLDTPQFSTFSRRWSPASPKRAGNYFESSGSAMFVYAMLKAVRLGYVRDADGSIVAASRKAFNYMTANWVVEKSGGTMDWKNTVEPDGDGSYEYYIGVPTVLNDLKGVAAFLLASLEVERLK
ncbi:Six-hairpin glycosidase [Coprinopsis sp. MPI-PUGE-AT-0042]|nr:Six-hairpin glycosidase [Coprinopsis sp. MPI-PUGE-AT-0042]